MKVTIELTPESAAMLKEWAEDLFRHIQKSDPSVQPIQPEVKSMTVEEFIGEPKEEVKVYKLEEVRAKLTELSRAGKREAVNELINSYGAKRLTDVKEEHYTELMQKAGEL